MTKFKIVTAAGLTCGPTYTTDTIEQAKDKAKELCSWPFICILADYDDGQGWVDPRDEDQEIPA